MKKKLTAMLFAALFLVGSFSLASCKKAPVAPNFENFPLDIRANLRWGTGHDAKVYLDLTITNNTDMTVTRAHYYKHGEAFFDADTISRVDSVRGVIFPDRDLKPHATAEITLDFTPITYIHDGKVATKIDSDLVFWWLQFDENGADWGDRNIEENYRDSHDPPYLMSEFYSQGYHVSIATSNNPF